MIQSRLFLLRDNNFINGALSDLTLCSMFSFTYTLHERSSSKIHYRGTLALTTLFLVFICEIIPNHLSRNPKFTLIPPSSGSDQSPFKGGTGITDRTQERTAHAQTCQSSLTRLNFVNIASGRFYPPYNCLYWIFTIY